MTIPDDKHKKRYNLLPFEHEFRLYADAVIKLTPISIKNYLSDYRYFFQWLTAQYVNLTVEMVEPHHLQAYRTYLEDQGLPRASINRRLSTLRAFYTFLVQQQILTISPMKSIKNISGVHSSTHIHSQVPDSLTQYFNEMRHQQVSNEVLVKSREYLEEFFSIIHSDQSYVQSD